MMDEMESLIDLRLCELSQLNKALLPAQVAHLGWNHIWDAFLRYPQLGAAEDFLQCDGDIDDSS